MGQRHASGALMVNAVQKLIITDINESALDTAKNNLNSNAFAKKINYYLNDDFYNAKLNADVVIMASTAANRIEECKKIIQLNPKAILLEKPLGQSMAEVEDLIRFFENHKIKTFVNLNTRLYPSFIKLKNDIKSLPQFNGFADVAISTGTIGIGANGIHYIDLMRFLFDADTIEFVAGEIDEQIIPSGRGPQFCDFGGWCVLNYKAGNKVKARVHFSLGTHSTSLGTMNFTFPHARVIIDEFEQKRYNKYRKSGSEMPVQRYAADYPAQEEEIFTSPDLKELTALWLQNLSEGKIVLPDINESIESHKVMYTWLSKSKTHKDIFPIT